MAVPDEMSPYVLCLSTGMVMVRSNHTFSSASLTKPLTSTPSTYACNWQQPFLNQGKEENDHRKYFINLIALKYSTGLNAKQYYFHYRTNTMNPDQTASRGPYCLQYRLPKSKSRHESRQQKLWMAEKSQVLLWSSKSLLWYCWSAWK